MLRHNFKCPKIPDLKIALTPKQTKIDIGDQYTNEDIKNINKNILVSKTILYCVSMLTKN